MIVTVRDVFEADIYLQYYVVAKGAKPNWNPKIS